MSACYFVRGIMEPTEDYMKKYAAFKACEEAGIEIPAELWKYFNDETPDPSGHSVKVPYEKISLPGQMKYEVDIKKLDPQVTKIQFGVGW